MDCIKRNGDKIGVGYKHMLHIRFSHCEFRDIP